MWVGNHQCFAQVMADHFQFKTNIELSQVGFSRPQQTTLKTSLFAKIFKNIMEGMISERKDTAGFRSLVHITTFVHLKRRENTVIILIEIFTWKPTPWKADFW